MPKTKNPYKKMRHLKIIGEPVERECEFCGGKITGRRFGNKRYHEDCNKLIIKYRVKYQNSIKIAKEKGNLMRAELLQERWDKEILKAKNERRAHYNNEEEQMFKKKEKNTEEIPDIEPIIPTQVNQPRYRQQQQQQQIPQQQPQQMIQQRQSDKQQLEEYPWSLQEVATETNLVIINQQTGETLNVMSALVKILNILEQ